MLKCPRRQLGINAPDSPYHDLTPPQSAPFAFGAIRMTDKRSSDITGPQSSRNATGAPVADNLNTMTAGPRGPALLQDIWLIEKLAHFDREVIPERRMHAKGWGAYGTFTVTHDITRYTKAKLFSEVGKQTPMFIRFSTVAGERGAADAERDIRGFAVKFYTEEGNWDIVGNNTPVFFFRDPFRFPDLNHAGQARPAHGPALGRQQLGLLVAAARSAAPGDHRDVGPGHTQDLPAYAWLRQPHVLDDQCR